MGQVRGVERRAGDARLVIAAGGLDLGTVALGDSICVSGVCLTVVELGADSFAADVSNETLQRTTLGELGVASPVNLERALTLSTRLGGHLVSGHVDGVARVLGRRRDARSERFEIEAPAALARYIAEKGSVTIDGVSLTVNTVDGARFSVNIVPHTATMTTIGRRRTGDAVNLEVDLLARYLERLMLGDRAADADNGSDTMAALQRGGFLEH